MSDVVAKVEYMQGWRSSLQFDVDSEEDSENEVDTRPWKPPQLRSKSAMNMYSSKKDFRGQNSNYKGWFRSEAGDLDGDDCFQDASSDFKSLAEVQKVNKGGSKKDEYFSLRHMAGMKLDDGKAYQEFEIYQDQQQQNTQMTPSVFPATNLNLVRRYRNFPFRPITQPPILEAKKSSSGGSKISYDSTGPFDERYYVPLKTSSTYKELTAKANEPDPPRVQSPSKRQIDRRRNKHHLHRRSYHNDHSHSSSHSNISDHTCGSSSNHCCRHSANCPNQKKPVEIRNLKSLFSKSTSALIERRNGNPEFRTNMSGIPDPDYSPMAFRRSRSKERASKFYYDNDQIKVGKKQTPKKPSLDLWGNAQRYKGSLENMLDSSATTNDQEWPNRHDLALSKDTKWPNQNEVAFPRETMKTALKNRPPIREFVSLLAQQQQKSHDRSGRRSLFFNPILEQHSRESRHLSTLPDIYPSRSSERRNLHAFEDSSNSRMSSARSSEDREFSSSGEQDVNTVRMYREIIKAMDRKAQTNYSSLQQSTLGSSSKYPSLASSSGNSRMLAYESSANSADSPAAPQKPNRKATNNNNPSHQSPFNKSHLSQINEHNLKPNNNISVQSSRLGPTSLKFQISRQNFTQEEETKFSSSLLEEVHFKQSHFFNSLFPSRANRFGYPVYPERELGIPSVSGPVSFAGFSPPATTVSSNLEERKRNVNNGSSNNNVALGPPSIQSDLFSREFFPGSEFPRITKRKRKMMFLKKLFS